MLRCRVGHEREYRAPQRSRLLRVSGGADMDLEPSLIRRLLLPLVGLVACVQSAQDVGASARTLNSAKAGSAQSSSSLPGPVLLSPDVSPPVARPLPAGFKFQATYLPDGFVESKNAKFTAFTFGTDATSVREAPALFRVWMRSGSGRPEFIIVIAESTGRSDNAIRPSGLRNARADSQMRPGVQVFVTSNQGWDVRWTERGVDVRVIVQAPSVTPKNIKSFVAGVQLT